MKVTYNWLKDFVDIKIAPAALADKLTMAGLEVTSLEERDGDAVFEIEVTSNRPDCLSVVGIAREVAAITGGKSKLTKIAGHHVTLPLRQAGTSPRHQDLLIEIENKGDCPLYTAKIIRDVTLAPSPDWLKNRLELVGCRSVNSIVDITNYILFAWGEPLHAFDLDKLELPAIIIRRAKAGEKIITIDGKEGILNNDILVIADKKKPVAVAGIMGGKDTEVTQESKNILLEAAVFNPIVIRRGRQGLGIQSESAYRFERGVDSKIVESASGQAAALIRELCGGRYVLHRSSGLPQRKAKSIVLNLPTVNKILSLDIPASKIKNILSSLGCKINPKTKHTLSVEAPSHRQDLNLEMDLIEEIARIFGFERIPTTLPKVSPQIIAEGKERFIPIIKNTLAGVGLNEVITYSLIDQDVLNLFGLKNIPAAVEILNPLSKEQGLLRPTIIPGLIRCVALNLNQKQNYVNIFEVGKVFSSPGKGPKEELNLAIALCGVHSLLLEQGLIKEEVSLLYLKGILETLFAHLGVKDYSFNNKESAAQITVYVNKEKVGFMTQMPRSLLEKLGIKNKEVFLAELSLEKIFSCADIKKRFVPLPIYPSISRDISIIIKETVALDDMLRAMREKGKPWLRDVKIVDYYKGKQIPSGFRSFTISCVYRSDERTLTEAQINPVHSLVSFVLADKFGAKIRNA
jgi:phenylalanyl-tRNA synthetase beta chain